MPIARRRSRARTSRLSLISAKEEGHAAGRKRGISHHVGGADVSRSHRDAFFGFDARGLRSTPTGHYQPQLEKADMLSSGADVSDTTLSASFCSGTTSSSHLFDYTAHAFRKLAPRDFSPEAATSRRKFFAVMAKARISFTRQHDDYGGAAIALPFCLSLRGRATMQEVRSRADAGTTRPRLRVTPSFAIAVKFSTPAARSSRKMPARAGRRGQPATAMHAFSAGAENRISCAAPLLLSAALLARADVITIQFLSPAISSFYFASPRHRLTLYFADIAACALRGLGAHAPARASDIMSGSFRGAAPRRAPAGRRPSCRSG